jgi:hypothetical protein
MPVLNVGERLCTPLGRIDLAADVIGAMVHPKDKTAMRRRRSAFAETLFAISDKDDEAEAMAQVKSWFRRAGGFKTASQADPYDKQQTVFLGQLPQILAAGTALHLVWAMTSTTGINWPVGRASTKQSPSCWSILFGLLIPASDDPQMW